MTDDPPKSDPMLDGPDPDMTAAELALGLLDGDERAAALRRVLADPAFAREVEDWRHRLAGLFDDYAGAEAPSSLAERLAKPELPAPRRSSGWPIIAVLTAIAAAFALFFVSRPAPLPTELPPVAVVPHKLMLASLTLTDKSGSVPALVDMTSGEVKIADAALTPNGKSAELWMIGDDGVPKSMGLLADHGTSRVILSSDKRKQLAEGITLAVSVEPVGGSPTGKPTGPVVAAGKLSLT